MVCTLKSYLFLLQRATFQMVVAHRKKMSQIMQRRSLQCNKVIKGPIWLTHVWMCVCTCVYWFILALLPWYKTVPKELVVLAVLIFTVNVENYIYEFLSQWHRHNMQCESQILQNPLHIFATMIDQSLELKELRCHKFQPFSLHTKPFSIIPEGLHLESVCHFGCHWHFSILL